MRDRWATLPSMGASADHVRHVHQVAIASCAMLLVLMSVMLRSVVITSYGHAMWPLSVVVVTAMSVAGAYAVLALARRLSPRWARVLVLTVVGFVLTTGVHDVVYRQPGTDGLTGLLVLISVAAFGWAAVTAGGEGASPREDRRDGVR